MTKRRKVQSILCGVMVCLCIVALHLLGMQLKEIEAVEQQASEEVVEKVVNTNEEQVIGINAEQLFTYQGKALNEQNVKEVSKQLLGSNCLSDMTLKQDQRPYVVKLSYATDGNDVSLSKTKRDQLALVNAVIMMSLFDEVDTVEITTSRAEEKDERILYRPDLENYFGLSLKNEKNKKSFTRVANEFLSMDHVNDYWNMSHPYDSELGEDAERFFKCYFAADDSKITLPVGQEQVEAQLRETYGYSLFIEGLNYDNANINYYCANQLMSFYGTDQLEEILLELVACSNKSKAWEVQAACSRAKMILTYKEKTPLLFTLYSELGGEDELYSIIDKKYELFAKWQGNEAGQIEIWQYSQNSTYVLLRISTNNSKYLYALPITGLDNWVLDEKQGENSKAEIYEELYCLMEVAENEKSEVDAEWGLGPVLKLTLEKDADIYNCKDKSITTEQAFNDNFDLKHFIEEAEEQYKLLGSAYGTNAATSSQYTQLVSSSGEEINCYEFTSKSQREQALSETGSPKITGYNMWHKGRLIITYNGKDTQLISLISQIMK